MFADLGTELEQLCAGAKNEIVLVAPFIKLNTLSRLLDTVDEQVHIRCVTRWRPDEIALGVSDIDIWLLFRERPNATLYLRPDLHAKYYRSDNRCLVGSANLTDTALGWSKKPNLELLIKVSADDLSTFEADLLRGCVTVDESYYQHMKSVVEKLEITRITHLPEQVATDTPSEYDDEIDVMPAEAWVPTLRHPEKLYVAYKGELDALTTASRIATLSDLQALDIPQGLNEADFNDYVGALLLQKPIIQRIDQFVVNPRRFGEVRNLLKSLPCADVNPNFDATVAWQTTMRWFLYFSDLYGKKEYNHTEVIQRCK